MLRSSWSKIVILMTIIVLVFGCSHNSGSKTGATSQNTVSTEEFIDMYVKLSIIAEQNLSDSVALRNKQDSLFRASEVTREGFAKFEEKINKDPEKWSEIWDKIVKKIKEESSSKSPPKLPEREKSND